MNKQPFYHRLTILFTAKREMTEKEVFKLVQKTFSDPVIVQGSVEIEEYDEPMPGDPYDLME